MSDEKHENTPAGSYRVAGNDVSGYLGVDNEYMNYADETQKAVLTEDEQFLFLPAPDSDTEESDDDDDDEADDSDEETDGDEESGVIDSDVIDSGEEPKAPVSETPQTVTITPTRAAL